MCNGMVKKYKKLIDLFKMVIIIIIIHFINGILIIINLSFIKFQNLKNNRIWKKSTNIQVKYQNMFHQ